MGNVAKVALEFSVQDDWDGAITFHAQKLDSAEPFSVIELDVLRARVHAWWTESGIEGGHDWEEVRSAFDENFKLVRITSQAIEPFLEDPEALILDAEDAHGTALSGLTILAPQLAVCIGLRTVLDTRRGRGRMYFPGVAASGYAGSLEAARGVILPEMIEQITGFVAHLAEHVAEPLNTQDPRCVMCVYSRVDGESHAVTHFRVRDRYATQRRRHGDVGYVDFGLSGDPAP